VPVKDKVHTMTCYVGRGEEYIYSSTLPLTSMLDGVGGQRHASAGLPLGMFRYPLYRGGRVAPRVVCVYSCISIHIYRMIPSVLDPIKCEYLKDYSLDFEHAYMTAYLAS
jgi:hypothetical protein